MYWVWTALATIALAAVGGHFGDTGISMIAVLVPVLAWWARRRQ